MDKLYCIYFRGNGGEASGSLANSLTTYQNTKKQATVNTIFKSTYNTPAPFMSELNYDTFNGGACKFIKNSAQ